MGRLPRPPHLPGAADRDGVAEKSHWVHPVQLYGVAINLVLFGAVLLYGSRFARRQGQTFFFFLTIEPILRFAAEQLRGDNTQFLQVLGFPLSPGQVVAVATVPLEAIGFAWASRRGQLIAAVPCSEENFGIVDGPLKAVSIPPHA